MLAGIVTMQVEVLKLGASVGRSIERTSTLQTRNELLRANVASLSDDGRIERLAAGMGLIMPTPGSAGFLSGASVSKAIANIHAPSSSTFLASTGTNGSVAVTDIMSGTSGVIAANLPGQAGSSSGGTTSSTGTSTAATDTTSATGASTATAPSSTAAASTTGASTTGASPTEAAPTATSPAVSGTAVTQSQQSSSSTGG